MKKVLILLLLFPLFLHPVNSGDFFHHLNTGKFIWENRKLPYLDEWSFTENGKPWIAHSWGSGVLFWVIWEIGVIGGIGGENLINIFFAFVGVVSAYFLYRVLRKTGSTVPAALILVFWGMTVISYRSLSKPESLGVLFISILLSVLSEHYPEGPAAQGSRTTIHLRTGALLRVTHSLGPLSGFRIFNSGPELLSAALPLLLPTVFFFWGIFYGSSVFLGILVLGIYLVTGRSGREGKLGRAGTFIICLIVSLLNGYGFRSLFYVFLIPGMSKYVGEWLPMLSTMNPAIPDLVLLNQWAVLAYLLFLIFITVIIVITVISGKLKWRKNIFYILLAPLVLLPFFSFRTLGFAPVFILPAGGIALTFFEKKNRKIILVVFMAIAVFSYAINLKTQEKGFGLSKEIFPVKAVDFMQKNGLSGKIFAPQEWGGYIIWSLPASPSTSLRASQIYIDTRDDLYIRQGIFEELSRLDNGEINIISLLDKYKVDAVLGNITNGNIYQPLFHDENWSPVFMEGGVFVAVKRDIAIQKNLSLAISDPFINPSPINKIESAVANAKDAIDKNDCRSGFSYLSQSDNLRSGKLIFFRDVKLPSDADRYWGEYYLRCDKNKDRARSYFLEYLKTVKNSVERKKLEERIVELSK